MILLSPRWLDQLIRSPETGMDYTIVTVVLKDGRRFDQVAIVGERITCIRGRADIPFTEDDIQETLATHDKWDFRKEW